MLRKKEEFDEAKKIASSAEMERKSLQKTLVEYRQKMMRLDEMIARNNRKGKKKMDESLDVSLDLSVSSDCF